MHHITFEYPDSTTIVIKRPWGVFSSILGLLIVVGFPTYYIFTTAQEKQITLFEALLSLVGAFGWIFDDSSGLPRSTSLLTSFALVVAFVVLTNMLSKLVDIGGFMRRKSMIDGGSRLIKVPLAPDIPFDDLESVYVRYVHHKEGEDFYLIGITQTDGSKHLFGTCENERERKKAMESIALVVGKPIEVSK